MWLENCLKWVSSFCFADCLSQFNDDSQEYFGKWEAACVIELTDGKLRQVWLKVFTL